MRGEESVGDKRGEKKKAGEEVKGPEEKGVERGREVMNRGLTSEEERRADESRELK